MKGGGGGARDGVGVRKGEMVGRERTCRDCMMKMGLWSVVSGVRVSGLRLACPCFKICKLRDTAAGTGRGKL